MGSQSDWATLRHAAETLDSLGIARETRIVSAHRTPRRMVDYASSARERGLQVIIAGAGGAAHLPGMIASHTVIPVIGVPIMAYNNKNQTGAETLRLSAFGGLDSLLSITEMPAGAPVVSVGINKAKNAGMYAAMILAVTDDSIRGALADMKRSQHDAVLKESEELQSGGL